MAKNRKMTAAITAASHDWETEDDLRTLCRAEEIEKDPKRMAKVQALAQKKMVEMAGVVAEGKGGE